MDHRDTVAALIFLGGGLHFKSVKSPTLASNADLSETWADIGVESIFVHSEVAGGIAKSDESGCNGRSGHGAGVVIERRGSKIESYRGIEHQPVGARL